MPIELGAEFLFVCFALLVVMALAGPFPRRWWLGAAPVFIGLAFLFGFIYPYLTPTERLERADLQAAGRAYAAYGSVYITAALVWLWAVEGARPDRWDLVGAGIALAGAAIIVFAPRPS